MKRRLVMSLVAILCALLGTVLISVKVTALESPLLITYVQASNAITAGYEAVRITNITDEPIDITGWKIEYENASQTRTTLVPFMTIDEDTRLLFPPSHSETFFSKQYENEHVGAILFSARIVDTSGTIRILDAEGLQRDEVAWGEGEDRVSSMTNNTGLERVTDEHLLQDTNNSMSDFRLVEQLSIFHQYGGLYEATDHCINITGIQESADEYVLFEDNCYLASDDVCTNLPGFTPITPEGYFYNDGLCVIDLCMNIPDIQSILPEGFSVIEGGCFEDLCDNLEGLQIEVPEHTIQSQKQCLPIVYSMVNISEVLANPIGFDEGNEFIELFNDTDQTITLRGYTIHINAKTFVLPEISVDGNAYVVLSDNDIGATFPNAEGKIYLNNPLGELGSNTVEYLAAPEGKSWANVENHWIYAKPTPDEQNINQVPESVVDSPITSLTPCQANQYRNPLTNRCRLIETVAQLEECAPNQERNPKTNRCRLIATASGSSLVPCAQGQERNPTTNRCRNILGSTSSLVPCKENQIRNPETNRCRNISSAASALKPCLPGQERNIATNRCKKVADTATLAATSGIGTNNMTNSTTGQIHSWYGLATGVVLVSIAYGAWEWRREAYSLVKRITGVFSKSS